MKPQIKTILTVVISIIFIRTTTPILMADECQRTKKVLAKEALDASASIWGNMRQHKGSVVYETSRLFHDAKDKINQFDKKTQTCADDSKDLKVEKNKGIMANISNKCTFAQYPRMTFVSTPKKFLADYDEFDKCRSLMNQTSIEPITFKKELPFSIDPLLDWIGDFSQGSGKEGRELYEKCDGSCSPQYKYVITAKNENLIVNASVVCGHARDKDDNLYNLSYELVWPCEKP